MGDVAKRSLSAPGVRYPSVRIKTSITGDWLYHRSKKGGVKSEIKHQSSERCDVCFLGGLGQT
jgi:hypothetical protein